MPPWQAGFALGELTHTRSVCVGVAEAGGINQCTQCVGWRRRDRGNEPMHAVRCLASPRQGMHEVRCLASPRQGKSSQREGNALFDDFWYFWSCKCTIKEELHYDSSLSEFFSLVRKERKGQEEEGIPLLISFCRLAATGANKVP